MPTELKRMTFVVTPDIEELMDAAKQKFYNITQSEMIRVLIIAGLNALNDNNSNNIKSRPYGRR